MTNPTILPELKSKARENAKAALMNNGTYLSLPMSDQKDIYLNLVEDNLKQLSKQYGISQPMAAKKGAGADMGFKDYDPGFEASVDAFEDLVDAVDFPQFVSDLLKGVFDANINVMKAQTDSYIKLMKEASKSVSSFVKDIKDEEAFGYLVENQKDQFNLQMEEDGEGGQKLALTKPDGEPVNMDDTAVKTKIIEAKIAMAKEHRAALREVILMGVTRLVVEKGEVEAAVEYKITANRKSKLSHKDQNINTVNAEFGYNSLTVSGKASVNNTNIQINTSSKDADDTLSAKLLGKVNIKFKTDYFKLDNFAQMYGDGGVGALKPNGQQPALPAPQQ